MNLRFTLGFLIVAVVLGAVVFGLDRFNIASPTAASATATSVAGQDLQVFQFDDARVTAFELQQGDKVVRVVRGPNGWVLAGTEEPANRSSFNSLIVRLSQLRSTRRVEAPSDLGQYGLDAPRDRAIVELDDGTRYELLVGSRTPVQSGTYARRADTEAAYVIADQLVNDLERLVGDPREPATPTPRPALAPTPAG